MAGDEKQHDPKPQDQPAGEPVNTDAPQGDGPVTYQTADGQTVDPNGEPVKGKGK